MGYHQTMGSAGQIAKAAIEHMESHEIPATPDNYTIWYEYFAGINAPLTETVLDMIDKGKSFDAANNREIYRKHFDSAGEFKAAMSAQNQMETIAQHLMENLAETGSGTEKYGEKLEDFTGTLVNAQDIDEIQGIIHGMLGDTRSMAERVTILQSEVAKSAHEISQLKEKLESARHDAMTDALTRIGNRKFFDETLDHAAGQAVENGSPLGLILCDLDHFKTFNDTYGHPIGDQVLRIVGRTLKERVKGQDTVARYGGEEFAVILPVTTADGAVSVAEDIRHSISSKKLKKKDGKTDFGTITMSFGVTIYEPGEILADFIARADEALYDAKRQGRNRVVLRQKESRAVA